MSKFLFTFLLTFVLSSMVSLNQSFAQFQFADYMQHNKNVHHNKNAKNGGCKKASDKCGCGKTGKTNNHCNCSKGNKHKMH